MYLDNIRIVPCERDGDLARTWCNLWMNAGAATIDNLLVVGETAYKNTVTVQALKMYRRQCPAPFYQGFRNALIPVQQHVERVKTGVMCDGVLWSDDTIRLAYALLKEEVNEA